MTGHDADAAWLRGQLVLGGRLDARFFALLRALELTGSLQKAARASGYSYKGAWLVLESAANMAHAPLYGSNSPCATMPSCASRTPGCTRCPKSSPCSEGSA